LAGSETQNTAGAATADDIATAEQIHHAISDANTMRLATIKDINFLD